MAGAALLAVLCTAPAGAKVLLTVEQALDLAFPGNQVRRESIFLTEAEVARAGELAGQTAPSALVVRYVARQGEELVGTAYFDTHGVRTLDETVMVVVRPDGTVGRVEVIAFNEPPDYMPRAAWYRQFDGRALDADLDLDRGIRVVAGATLTATATTAAVRRVLAIHRTLQAREARP